MKIKKKKIGDIKAENDLPTGSLDRWRHGFVTTYGRWLGTRDNMWVSNNEECVDVMDRCWSYIYGQRVLYKIESIRDPVYVLVRCALHTLLTLISIHICRPTKSSKKCEAASVTPLWPHSQRLLKPKGCTQTLLASSSRWISCKIRSSSMERFGKALTGR